MNLFPVFQTILAIVLIICILLQSRGAGLGGAWGGGGELYTTRRGIEKLLFRGTIVVAVLFVIVSFTSLLV
ncbi:MAG: preprotein translocase subunit SecG [Candidatus Blackburnbacteria bacterium]|nr:preprotein translocase subunit SecG [Candidatus Blackburnbacteria bacterium]